MKKIRVLLVDDHPIVREGIRRLLELEERIVVVAEAGSAEEALSKMSTAPDVILMDIRLPGLDGIAATSELRDTYPDVKVVILSSFGNEYLHQAIEAGARGYILKTATQLELANSVLQVVDGQAPIDPKLTTGLLDRLAELSKLARQSGLSQRQHEVLRQVAAGVPSKEIAARLATSDATFKREIKAIFKHLGVNDRPQAVAEAYNRGLL